MLSRRTRLARPHRAEDALLEGPPGDERAHVALGVLGQRCARGGPEVGHRPPGHEAKVVVLRREETGPAFGWRCGCGRWAWGRGPRAWGMPAAVLCSHMGDGPGRTSSGETEYPFTLSVVCARRRPAAAPGRLSTARAHSATSIKVRRGSAMMAASTCTLIQLPPGQVDAASLQGGGGGGRCGGAGQGRRVRSACPPLLM